MKKCGHCKQLKDEKDFYKDKTTKDGYSYICKECQSERNKIYREKNKDKLKKYKDEYYKKRGGYTPHKILKLKRYKQLMEIGLMTDCVICGFPKEKIAAIEFHHLKPEIKKFKISSVIAAPKKFPLEVLREEIKNCICLCSNCHRLLHAKDEETLKKLNEVINVR